MTTIFIARLQPIHEGHKQVIEKYKEEFKDFKLLIGSANRSREQENPLNFKERKKIVQKCFPNLEIEALGDEAKDKKGNQVWVSKIIEKFEPDRVISRNELVLELFQEQGVEVVKQELIDRDVYSGTEVRRRIRSGEEWRYLVPECARDSVEKYIDIIKETGIQYEFKPGWKKENAYYDTAEK